jgi:sugar phosphate permease
VLVLLGLSIFINYIDRANLSVAAPLLKSELVLSASQLGILLSAFFWTYSFMQIPVGWLDRFEAWRRQLRRWSRSDAGTGPSAFCSAGRW